MATASELMSEYMGFMDPLTALLKKSLEGLPDDFPPVEGFLHSIKGFMEKTKAYLDGENVKIMANIGNNEEKLGKMAKLIKFIEEQQAEL